MSQTITSASPIKKKKGPAPLSCRYLMFAPLRNRLEARPSNSSDIRRECVGLSVAGPRRK